MNDVTLASCHLCPMYRLLLFCHNKRSSYELDFIIEEPHKFTYLQKIFQVMSALDISSPKKRKRQLTTISFLSVPCYNELCKTILL